MDRQLVRFRGMIQDMHNPEYYFQQYEVKDNQTETHEIRCGMYADSAQCLVIIQLKCCVIWPIGTLSYPCLNSVDIPD